MRLYNKLKIKVKIWFPSRAGERGFGWRRFGRYKRNDRFLSDRDRILRSQPVHRRLSSLLAVASLLGWALASASSYTTIPMSEKSLATYYIQASLGDFDGVEFMVDTGAGYTTINEDTLRALKQAGNAVYVGQLTGVMADGSRRELPVYRVRRLVLGGDCALHDIEVAVFPSNTRMLLGLSALRKASPFVFSIDPPRLSLSNCQSVSG